MDRKTRICILSLNAYALFNPSRTKQIGGAEVDAYLIGKALAETKDYAVMFVVADFGQPLVEKYAAITVIKSFSLNTAGFRRFIGYLLGIPLLFRALYKAHADVYFYEAPGMEAGLLAIFCKLFRKKFIYRTASTIDCDGSYRRMSPFRGILFEYGLRSANAVVAEFRGAAELLRKKYNIHATTIYDVTDIKPSQQLMPIAERPYILWVGRLVEMKRADIFLALAQEFPSVKFLLIGLPEKSEPLTHTRVQKITGGLPNVLFIPGVQPSEIGNFYSQSRVLINTSDFEGFPNVFIEAHTFGIPVISLRVNPDNYLTEHKVGFHANAEPKKLRDCLNTIITNDALLNTMSNNALAYVKKYHDIHDLAQRYHAVLETIL